MRRAKKIRVLLMDVDGTMTPRVVCLQAFPDGSVGDVGGVTQKTVAVENAGATDPERVIAGRKERTRDDAVHRLQAVTLRRYAR